MKNLWNSFKNCLDWGLLFAFLLPYSIGVYIGVADPHVIWTFLICFAGALVFKSILSNRIEKSDAYDEVLESVKGINPDKEE